MLRSGVAARRRRIRRGLLKSLELLHRPLPLQPRARYTPSSWFRSCSCSCHNANRPPTALNDRLSATEQPGAEGERGNLLANEASLLTEQRRSWCSSRLTTPLQLFEPVGDDLNAWRR